MQYFEIYNDHVIDLLAARPDKPSQNLKPCELSDGSISIPGSVSRVIETIDDAFLALMQGQH